MLWLIVIGNRIEQSLTVSLWQKSKTWVWDNFDWLFLLSPWQILLLWLKMFIWYRREKLKSSIDFLPATETNVLQTSIPARCTLRAFRERWSMKKVDNSPNELTPVLTHTLMRSLQQHSPFFNNKGQSHTYGWHSKARVVKELLHFQLMNNTENSLRRVKRVSMNEKGQFVPDSPIPSAALWEHGVLCGDSPSFVLTGREGWEMEPCSEGENTAHLLVWATLKWGPLQGSVVLSTHTDWTVLVARDMVVLGWRKEQQWGTWATCSTLLCANKCLFYLQTGSNHSATQGAWGSLDFLKA